jgi:predicted Fe-Mo cluster-binding NifX family protein
MEVMSLQRIGIGTADMVSMCDHLAHSSAFIVLELEDGRVTSRTTRQRGSGACGNHATFVEMLEGCSAVLCGGIGQGAANALTSHGILPIVAAKPHSIEDAVALYLSGELVTTTERVCLCG